MQSLSTLFMFFFLMTKLTIAFKKLTIAFKSSFGLCPHPLIIEFFYLPSNSSESRKKYTLSLPLMCLQEVEFWKLCCLWRVGWQMSCLEEGGGDDYFVEVRDNGADLMFLCEEGYLC